MTSLIVGVASASAAHSDILLAGVTALVAGAMSMVAGEYVWVSSQSDTEKADIARETAELASDNEADMPSSPRSMLIAACSRKQPGSWLSN